LPIQQHVQRRILHRTENAAGIVEFAVVQVSEGGQNLGILDTAAGLQHAVGRDMQGHLQAGEFANQKLDIAVGIQELLPGPCHLVGGGFSG